MSPGDSFYRQNELILAKKFCGSLETSKMVKFGCNLHTWSFGKNLGFFSFFKCFNNLGPGDELLQPKRANFYLITLGQPAGDFESVRFGWNLAYTWFLVKNLGSCFTFFENFYFFGPGGEIILLNFLLMFTIGPMSNANRGFLKQGSSWINPPSSELIIPSSLDSKKKSLLKLH